MSCLSPTSAADFLMLSSGVITHMSHRHPTFSNFGQVVYQGAAWAFKRRSYKQVRMPMPAKARANHHCSAVAALDKVSTDHRWQIVDSTVFAPSKQSLYKEEVLVIYQFAFLILIAGSGSQLVSSQALP